MFENQQHALFHHVCNSRLFYVFNETEMAKKEKDIVLRLYKYLCNLFPPVTDDEHGGV